MTIGQIASINLLFYFVHMSISKNWRKVLRMHDRNVQFLSSF
jgi:hypothetical protein